jgi:hypothetical protein
MRVAITNGHADFVGYIHEKAGRCQVFVVRFRKSFPGSPHFSQNLRLLLSGGFTRGRQASCGGSRQQRCVPAFYPAPATFHHQASDQHYELSAHDRKFFQNDHQIDYVMGSGNHASIRPAMFPAAFWDLLVVVVVVLM